MPKATQRTLAAIVAADIAGYSRLVGQDEEGTIDALRAIRREVVDPLVEAHGGRIANTAGDGLLFEFPSVVDATRFAVAMQRAIAAWNAGVADDRALAFRVGINLGDIVRLGSDILGDGVNVAARIEARAEPGGITISEDAYRQVRDRLQEAWRDDGEHALKNIARPLRLYSWLTGGGAASAARAGGMAELPEQPSLAVLPFLNMTGDAGQEPFCDGLTEDLITTLTQLPGIRVVARHSSFALKGQAVDLRDAAARLGARYALAGSVRRAADRIRISVQLVDARDGTHRWAERYDRRLEDIFAIQDEITLAVATEMLAQLTEGEQIRLRYRTAHNVEAWAHWVRGLAYLRRPVAKEEMGRALRHWEQALELDPSSAALAAMVGFIHCLDARFCWWQERGAALAAARDHAERALGLDPDNADAHTTLSLVALFEERFDEAVRYARRAVDLAPGSADTAELASFVLAPCGFAEEAVALSRRAIALSPHHPPVYLGQLGNAYHLTGQIPEAIATFEEFNARSPGFGLVDLVIIHQQNGQPDLAQDAARRLLAARPGFSVASWRKTQFRRDKARLERDIAALWEAGLPA